MNVKIKLQLGYSMKAFIKTSIITFIDGFALALTAPLLLLFSLSKQKEKQVIMLDVKHWIEIIGWTDKSDLLSLLALLKDSWHQEFRNLYYYRVSKGGFGIGLLVNVANVFYPGRSNLIFQCDNIGPGLFIQHGFSTIIAAKSVGENCWINQQVTIGFKDATSCPTIGNNVTINAGAKVIGAVTIYDNVTVGANAVVVKSVPQNCVVVGVPAYIIKKNGVKVREQLV